jgi:hypothetical protein
MKLFTPAPVVEGMIRLGYPLQRVARHRIVLLVCVACMQSHASFLGAILLTGYLGGAVATHVALAIRCSRTFCSQSISAVILGLLRNQKLRTLVPLYN